MKKIIFVEPRGARSNVFAKYMMLPLLGPVYLATILNKNGYVTEVINENILGRDLTIKDLNCDILCISIITSTAQRGYEIADMFKESYPEKTIIIGGIHASFMPEESIQHADYVATFEGEERILDIIEGRKEKGIIQCNRIEDMDSIPFPDFSLVKGFNKKFIQPVMFSRGCPFNCSFCTVTRMFGRRYRVHSDAYVLNLLKNIPNSDIFVYDDNFAADIKRTDRILDGIIALNKKFEFSAQVRTDIAKHPHIVKKMSEAGFHRVYIGIESINERSLKGFQKRQDIDDIKRAINVFHKFDIKVHGMFIFGTDEDTPEIFDSTVGFCKDEGIDTVQYLALTPLPGTPVFDEFRRERRLLHEDWQYYDGQHVVFKPKNMTPEELQRGIIDSYKSFYSYLELIDDILMTGFDFFFNLPSRIFPKIDRIKHRIMGRYIVNRWLSFNREYLSRIKS
ncbi:MAG: B12-binding domain-containing radical SAM protein [Deltaproteobacteria bacterium]|nr:B12-binding domain-containing radical SAM protein [Deltaproteobacteria bacterium]